MLESVIFWGTNSEFDLLFSYFKRIPPSTVCFSFQGTIQALARDETMSAAESAQWEDAKSVNDAAASQGIRIRRHCRPTASMKEIEEKRSGSRMRRSRALMSRWTSSYAAAPHRRRPRWLPFFLNLKNNFCGA